MCEALRVKSKVEWRLQEVREVRKRQAMHVWHINLEVNISLVLYFNNRVRLYSLVEKCYHPQHMSSYSSPDDWSHA
jgi:hypothetical protein